MKKTNITTPLAAAMLAAPTEESVIPNAVVRRGAPTKPIHAKSRRTSLTLYTRDYVNLSTLDGRLRASGFIPTNTDLVRIALDAACGKISDADLAEIAVRHGTTSAAY